MSPEIRYVACNLIEIINHSYDHNFLTGCVSDPRIIDEMDFDNFLTMLETFRKDVSYKWDLSGQYR